MRARLRLHLKLGCAKVTPKPIFYGWLKLISGQTVLFFRPLILSDAGMNTAALQLQPMKHSFGKDLDG